MATSKKYPVLPLYMDLQAKNIFGTNRNSKFLKDMLEKYLNVPRGSLKKIKIKNSVKITPKKIRDKTIEMDILVELPNKNIINLEFYSSYDKIAESKSFYYLTGEFGNQLDSGENYNLLHQVNQINFLHDDKLRKKKLKPVNRYIVMNKDDPKDVILENLFQMDIVDVDIKEKIIYNGYNEGFEAWRKFIGAQTEEEMKKLAKRYPILEEAFLEMKRFSQNEEVQNYNEYERFKNSQIINAKEEGVEEGFEQGIEQNKIDVAMSMLEENETDEKIMKYVNITKEELDAIKQELED